MNTATYNPFAAAFSAAWAELSSPQAIAYYTDRAYQDMATCYEAATTLARMAYQLGVMARYALDDLVEQSTATEPSMAEGRSETMALAGFAPVGLLSEAKPRRVLVPPPPAKTKPQSQPLAALSIRKLKAIAKARGLTGYSHLRKSELVLLLQGAAPLAPGKRPELVRGVAIE